jgi:hypothetical protein
VVALYSLALLLGTVAAIGWVVAGVAADGALGRLPRPEERFGRPGRIAVTALMGFGLGGLSASFAGWAGLQSVLVAVGGAGFLVASMLLLAEDPGSDGPVVEESE